MKFIELVFLLFLTLCVSANSSINFANNLTEMKSTITSEEEQKVFELVNNERAKKGLSSLKWNPKLAVLARNYSEKMARERFFSHFDRNGNNVSERAKALRITKWQVIGENLFMGEGYEKIEQTAVKGWMKSQIHRDNILEDKFNETGIGLARSRD